MSKITGIQIGDCHADDVAPSSRIDDYNEAFFRKIAEIRTFVEENNTQISLWTGDWFHKKDPWRVSHRLVNRLERELLAFPKWHTCYSVVGNHDITADNIETLPKQPLYGLFQSGALTWIKEGMFVKSEDLKVQISGADYSPVLDYGDRSLYKVERLPDADFVIKLVHGFLLKPTEEWFVKDTTEGFTRMNDICHFGFDALFHGHRHDDVGVINVGNVPFVNYGALMRGSIAEMNIKRKPKIGVFEVTKEKNVSKIKIWDYVLKSAIPPEEIFNLSALAEQKEHDVAIAQFVEKLGQEVGAVSDFDLASMIDKLDIFKDIPERYKKRAKAYLEAAQD